MDPVSDWVPLFIYMVQENLYQECVQAQQWYWCWDRKKTWSVDV